MIAIDIGTYTTKIVTGRMKKKSIFIQTACSFYTPPKSYYDGQIQDLDALAKAITNAIIKNKIKTKKVVFSVQSTSSIIREFLLPFTKPKELKSMLGFEIEQHLPIKQEEYVIEYKILEEFLDSNNIKRVRVLVAALPKKIVESYFELAKILSLKPIGLDIHADIVAKLFKTEQIINTDQKYTPNQTISLISFGYRQIHITIIERGFLKLQWLISQGGNDIDMHISNVLNLTLTESLKKKEKYAILENTYTGDYTSVTLINKYTASVVNIWIQEIQRIFQYYMSRNKENKIDMIYIYGGTSNISGLASYIKTQLNIPTIKIEKINNILFKESNKAKEILIYLNAAATLIKR